MEPRELVAELKIPLRAFKRVYATVEDRHGAVAMVHSPYIGSLTVGSVEEGLAHGRASDEARAAGVAPRELRTAGTGRPAYLAGRPNAPRSPRR